MSVEQTTKVEQLPDHPTFEEWKKWFETRVNERAAKAHREFVALERSQYPPQGWDPGFHGPGEG